MIYGVWLRGQGWLKNERGVFAAQEKEIAEAAASFYRHSKVLSIDQSMKDFENEFIRAEKAKSIWAILTS
jgi:hypothetical protein